MIERGIGHMRVKVGTRRRGGSQEGTLDRPVIYLPPRLNPPNMLGYNTPQCR